MRRRALTLVALLALVLLAAGCGGGGGGGAGGDPSTGNASAIVPADALLYATIDTDQSSAQLSSARTLVEKFPIEKRLVAQIVSSATQNGVDFTKLAASVGSVLDVAVLKTGTTTGAVGFAKPSDEQAFDAQLGKLVQTTVSGWTVFAQSQALLTAVTSRSASLADDADFKDAIGSLPGSDDAVARVYAPGSSLKAMGNVSGVRGAGSLGAFVKPGNVTWLAGALTSQGGSSLKLELHVEQSSTGSGASSSGLADQIPAGAIAALSLTGGTASVPAGADAQLGTLSQSLGVDLPALVGIFKGPVIAYVKPGTPIPEVTVAAKPADPAGAEQAIGSLVAKLLAGQGGAAPSTTTVDGVVLKTVELGPIGVYWGRFGDELVFTDNPAAVSVLKEGPSTKLADDSTFKKAADAAGLPDQNQGFFYLDLKDALPLIEGIAQLAGQKVPPQVHANLAPLETILAYGSRDGTRQTFVVDVETS